MALLFLESAVVLLLLFSHVRSECSNFELAENANCDILYESLEAALVGSQTNLFNLRKMFFPSSTAEPVLLNVEYELSFGFYLNDTTCQEIEDARNVSSMANIISSAIFHYGWTSKVFYTIFHPAQVNRMQPQLAFIAMSGLELANSDMVQTALNWDGIGEFETLTLPLHIPSLPFVPTCEELSNTLQDITSLLKVYAEAQGNITTWDSEEAGFALVGNVLGEGWWEHTDTYGSTNIVIPAYVISGLTAAIVSLVIVVKVTLHNERDRTKLRAHRSVLWPLTGILLQCNFALLLAEVIQIGKWCAKSACGDIGITKIVWLICIFAMSVFTFILLFLIKSARKRIESNKLLSGSPGLFSGILFVNTAVAGYILYTLRFGAHARERTTNKMNKAMFFIFLITCIVSIALVAFNVIPVIVLLLIYPFRVITFYTSVAAAFVLYVLAIVVTEHRRSKYLVKDYVSGEDPNFKEVYITASLLLTVPYFVSFFVVMSSLVFIYVYQTLVSGALDNPILIAIVSLVPSVVVSSPALWLYKRVIVPEFKPEEQDDSSEQMEDTSGVYHQYHSQEDDDADA